MFKFLENAQTNLNVVMATTAIPLADLFKDDKDDKVSDTKSVADLVKRHLDSGDFARVNIKTGRRIG